MLFHLRFCYGQFLYIHINNYYKFIIKLIIKYSIRVRAPAATQCAANLTEEAYSNRNDQSNIFCKY